jgi:hypothetical protein
VRHVLGLCEDLVGRLNFEIRDLMRNRSIAQDLGVSEEETHDASSSRLSIVVGYGILRKFVVGLRAVLLRPGADWIH